MAHITDTLTAQDRINDKLKRYFNVTLGEANNDQLYNACVGVVRDELLTKRQDFTQKRMKKRGKRVYYLCMEFLLGQSLKTSLFNLKLDKIFGEALKPYVNIEDLYDLEPDAGLGNGGLGRLAACFLDGLAAQNYPAMGYTIRYDYGLFKQRIVDGWQTELPDNWLPGGEPWMIQRKDHSVTVRLNGKVEYQWIDGRMKPIYIDCDEILAMPYEMIISGYGNGASTLRMWSAKTKREFDIKTFGTGDYTRVMRLQSEAELISKVLYPADHHLEGKTLRLKQEYFLVSASIQNIIADHIRRWGDLHTLPDMAAIHINDTHPALCIPELMRILMDEHDFGWDEAFDIVSRTVAYTNHTVMAEALEEWDQSLVQTLLPRIYDIILELDHRHNAHLRSKYPGDESKVQSCAILYYNKVRMANLSIVGSHHVNGVSALHSDILKDTLFRDFYNDTPEKFTNVTNGIAYRRWLCQSNPGLNDLIKELIGEKFMSKASELSKLKKFAKDKTVLDRLAQIKYENKVEFANYLYKRNGVVIDPQTRFDVQAKRIHEYKRQLLNALKVIALMNEIRENPNKEVTPQTFIFAGKAASGYYVAKQLIRLVCALSREIESDPRLKGKINCIFLENYAVSVSEKMMPASEVSQQISLAGKEASGTGNMKFMLNGALTIGTLDGANVEMSQEVGLDNIFIFGMTADEVENLWKLGYNSTNLYNQNHIIRGVIETLNGRIGGENFSHIAQYLLTRSPIADPYMCLADFESYMQAHEKMDALYKNPTEWNQKSLINISKAGKFAADRSIEEYAKNIWNLKKV
ncbi:MAG: glycogen/starch/alpha-glucan phosphorylase [Clostridia bacterium]|nr:glycogen/starch/alpha-glucan phosphorylase [Clostridia bacterium]